METAIPLPPEPIRSFFWLAAVDIVYSVEGGLHRTRSVNVVTNTHTPYANQTTLGNIQKSAQVQVMQFKKIPRKAKIEDVTIHGPWMIGHMTMEEFEKTGPTQEVLGEEPEAPANDTAN